jgi:hypothetical protein
MKLSHDIKTVVKQEGVSILSEERFVNILNDMNSFENDIALQNVFKDLIKKGFISKISSIYDVSDKTSLIQRIKSKTGYDSDIITTIVDAVLFGLDKKIEDSSSSSIPSNTSPSNSPAKNNRKSKWWIWLLVFGLIAAIGSIFLFSSNDKRLYRIQENGKYGFIDSLGNVVITPQYKYVSDFTKDGYALIISSMNSVNDNISIKYGYINKKNKLVIDTTNVYSISKKAFLLYHNLDADKLIKAYNKGELSFTASFLNELLLINDRFVYQDHQSCLGYKFGYKNSNNEIVIPANYSYCRAFIEDVAFVKEALKYDTQRDKDYLTPFINSYSLIDKNGNYISERAFVWTQDFNGGKTWVKKAVLRKEENGEIDTSTDFLQIDKTGKTILGPIPTSPKSAIFNSRDNDLYLYLIDYFDSKYVAYTYINNDGNLATTNSTPDYISFDSIFVDATMFSQGYAAIRVFENNENKTPRWIFIDKKFNFPNEVFYDSVIYFSNDLCPVMKASELKGFGKWGFVDTSFKIAIDYKFDEVSVFRGALAYAKISGTVVDREGYINQKGEFIWSTERKKK